MVDRELASSSSQTLTSDQELNTSPISTTPSAGQTLSTVNRNAGLPQTPTPPQPPSLARAEARTDPARSDSPEPPPNPGQMLTSGQSGAAGGREGGAGVGGSGFGSGEGGGGKSARMREKGG